MAVARELAKSANSLIFEDLPSDVIHQTERLVLDTLGCAIPARGIMLFNSQWPITSLYLFKI